MDNTENACKVTLILKNGYVYNSHFKKFFKTNVYIMGNRFYYIGDENVPGCEDAIIYDVSDKYIVPGLVDCHMHIESSMMTPGSFSAAIIKHGITTIVAEPHEIANVFGVNGIKKFMEEAKDCPVDIRLAIPSSVPSTTEQLETTGGCIDRAELIELLQEESLVCLGEIMNCREAINDSTSRTKRLIDITKEYKPSLPIEGHVPAFLGLELAKIKYVGVGSDHTEQTPQRIEERVKNGIFVQLQKKSLREENIKYIIDNNLTEYFALVTDDTMPDALLDEGHLDVILKKAVFLGLPIEQAIYNATYTPARHMGLKEKGAIVPGNDADFVVLSSLEEFIVEKTFTAGKKVYDSESVTPYEVKDNIYPEEYYNSIRLSQRGEQDYIVRAPIAEGKINCRVLHVKTGTTFVTESVESFVVKNNEVVWEDTEYALLVVTERYGHGGACGIAFVTGDCLKEGAVATSYAHDHHNLLVLGHNKKDIALAANTVIGEQGGIAVVTKGQVKAFVSLPIGGIVSPAPIETLGVEVSRVSQALKQLGYHHSNVIMSLSTLGLPVSPEFKVTDKGIIDVKKQVVVPLFVE